MTLWVLGLGPLAFDKDSRPKDFGREVLRRFLLLNPTVNNRVFSCGQIVAGSVNKLPIRFS